MLKTLLHAKEISEEEVLKENLIKLVKEHKDHCNTPDCGISLMFVLKLAEKAGLKFTDLEKRIFH